MAAADDLRLLITGYTEMVANLDIMIARLDAELAALNAEITTITDGVMGAAETAILAKLEAKRALNAWQLVITWGDFGTINITEWAIHGWDGNPWSAGITRLSDDSFRVTGAIIPTVPVTMVKIQPGDIERTVISVGYVQPEPGPDPPAADGTTTVNLQPGETALPPSIDSFERTEIVYQFNGTGWDSDADIIQDQDAFALGYDEINAAIDLNGTYGLNARVSNITTGRDVQVLNRAKYQSFVTLYEPYAAP